jgi:transposase InsO family protein
MLKPDQDSANKHRLAFAKAHANEMWQADTLYGPHVHLNGSPVQTRLIAFIDDASRVCCHGQFFPAENVDTLIESIRAAFYKRGVPHALYVDNGSIYSSKEILQICARVGCLLHHTPVRDGAATHGGAKSCRVSRRSSFKGKRKWRVLATGSVPGATSANTFCHRAGPGAISL